MAGDKVVGGEIAGGAFEGRGGVIVAGLGFALGAERFGFQSIDFLICLLEG